MKRVIGLMIAMAMMMSIPFQTVYAADNMEEATTVIVDGFEVEGVEYYQGMEVIEDKSQLEYKLNIESIVFDGNSIRIKAKIFYKNNVIATFDEIGTIYKSTAKKLVKVNGITAIFAPQNNFEIVSCSFEETADLGELLPVNENMNGKTVVKLAVKKNNKILYFEGEAPLESKYNKIFDMALDPSSEIDVMEEMKGVSKEVGVSEKEIVQLAEHWKHSLLSSVEEVTVIGNATQEIQTRATSPVQGVPVSVFTQEGTYKVAYISSNLDMGYFAVTSVVAGTNNFVTDIIKWEYLRNPCGNISAGSYVATDGTVGFNILDIAEYTYYVARDSIECTDDFIPYRIKNATVEMGLRSKQEILTRVSREIQANGSAITVNWASLLGLLPLGEVYSTTASLFGAIEYRNDNVSSASVTFQAQAQAQENVYGKLVRGYKLVDNGKYFAKNGDKLQFDFRVAQPSDLTRAAGTNYIANKYYFEIYERNAFTLLYNELVYTVNQSRTSSYYVYK